MVTKGPAERLVVREGGVKDKPRAWASNTDGRAGWGGEWRRDNRSLDEETKCSGDESTL